MLDFLSSFRHRSASPGRRSPGHCADHCSAHLVLMQIRPNISFLLMPDLRKDVSLLHNTPESLVLQVKIGRRPSFKNRKLGVGIANSFGVGLRSIHAENGH